MQNKLASRMEKCVLRGLGHVEWQRACMIRECRGEEVEGDQRGFGWMELMKL